MICNLFENKDMTFVFSVFNSKEMLGSLFDEINADFSLNLEDEKEEIVSNIFDMKIPSKIDNDAYQRITISNNDLDSGFRGLTYQETY